MSKTGGPDLKKYLDKKLAFKLNGNRKVTGVLRGFDQFMNIVLDGTIEDVSASEKNDIGMVVSASKEYVYMYFLYFMIFICVHVLFMSLCMYVCMYVGTYVMCLYIYICMCEYIFVWCVSFSLMGEVA